MLQFIVHVVISMAGENGPRAWGGLTFVTYIFKILMVSRKHILMLTVQNVAPWVPPNLSKIRG